jgi:predicted kinase
MSCIITYKGQKYSEEQFKEYFINNKQEFVTSIAKNKNVIDSFKRKMEGIDVNLYSQYLEQNPNGSVEQFKSWVEEFNKNNKLLQESGSLTTISKSKIDNLQSTVEYQLLNEKDEDLDKKIGQSYMFLSEKDAQRFTYLVERNKEFPEEFKVTKKITKYEKDSKNPLKLNGYNEYVDFYYIKSNKNKKSNLYDIINKETGEVIASKVRVLSVSKDSKSEIAKKYGLEHTPTKVFNANRSIAFALYRQKPSKAKYIAQAKKYLYDAIKFLNPEETNLKINLNKIEELLSSFPEEMWDYINTTYSPEDSTNINASISLQNEIKFNLPKLGFIQEIEKITGIPLQGVSFKNYDRSGFLAKVFKYSKLNGGWGNTITIDNSMTTKELQASIRYYLSTKNVFKSTTEEENVRKYAEHRRIDYDKLKELVFGDIDKALDNIAYNNTGNSDTIELSKWRESIRNYDWQSVELFSKPYENFQNTVKERIITKFKDKNLSNGISHLEYFFNSGSFNWLNINFNNISGQYYLSDMETEANVGVKTKMGGIINPFEMKIYQKPKAGENFLQEKEIFNRLAAVLHEPFHALHALSYGTKEELELRKAFDNLYRTEFGKEMMNQVFGSGYNNQQQISYDTLYKEFTAFTTQLMLYPKQWIKNTDLRSNDIYEFIEKIQTLQDKTYEEIVKTQQKIGTIEKTITEEEQIKLSFLEKLYNYLVKALNKIIPLSKKFTNLIVDSKLVEKKVIEDVFGEVEETVTKTLKLPDNVKKSKEQFLEAMKELQSAINTLMQIDGKLFSSENITNFFTSNKFNQEQGSLSDYTSQKSQENNSFQQFQQSLNKPNTNPILQGNQKPDVILPIGTSGSGKSTFIKSLPQENLVVIEPDAMRVEFTGDMNDKSKDKEIYEEAAKRAVQAIKQGKQVVFDTTNLTKDKRLPFIEAIKKEIPNANIQYKLMELNPELAKQRIKADIAAGKNRANVPDATIDRHAESYKQMLEDIKSEPISNFDIQQEQVKKFTELQERLNNKEFLEGAKNAFESSEELQQFGTQEEYNSYIARVSLGIIKNPSSGEYNYYSKVKDIVYRGGNLGTKQPQDVEAFTTNKSYAKYRAEQNNTQVYPAILNIQESKLLDKKEIRTLSLDRDEFEYQDYGFTDNKDQTKQLGNFYTIKENNRHILGSKQDIEGFKEFLSDTQKRKIGTNEFRNTESNDFTESEQNNKYLYQEIKESGGNLLWTSSEGYRYGINNLQELRNFTEKDAKFSNFKKENNRMGALSFRFSPNSSNFDKYIQSSYREIWKEASEINNLEANIVASTFIAQQISEPTNKFYGRLLSRIRDSFGVQANGNISLEDDTAYLYVDDKNSISINLYRIGQYMSKFKSFNDFQKDLENTLNEESIHLAITNLATDEEMKQVFNEMTPSQIKDVKEIYGSIKSIRKEDDKINLAHEFIRMIIQNKYTSKITESSNPILFNIINKLLDKVKEWLGNEVIKTNEILNRFDNLVNKSQLNISKKSKELSNLPNNQWFNRTIEPIINRFSKMFPNVRSVVISEKEIPKEVKSIVQGLDKQINSFFHKGQVYIIKERVTKDIAIEEFLHPFVNALEQDNPELFKSLLLEAKKLFPELKEEIFTKYGKVYNSIFDLNREFLTQALTKRVSEQIPEQETFFQKFKTWIKSILDRLFGNEATTREISMLDETMSLTDLASILNENNTQFNFNPNTNTTYYSLNEEEVSGILNDLKAKNATNIQKEIVDKILQNNKVTETDFIGDKHEYTRNELGEIIQLKPVSSFLPAFTSNINFEHFAEIGNVIHDIVHNITINTLSREQFIETYAKDSKLKQFLVDEKGFPFSTVTQIISNLHDYISKLKGDKSILISEVSISHLQEIDDVYKGVAGTIDLLEIKENGSIIIHDFKSMFINTSEKESNNEITQTLNKFKSKESLYSKQLSLYKKLLQSLDITNNITLQIVPVPYLGVIETTNNTKKVIFNPDTEVYGKDSIFKHSNKNYVYNPISSFNFSKDQEKFQVFYNKDFANKVLPSIKEIKEEKKLTKKELDKQELLNNLTDKIKGENSKEFEVEIEKVFKQVTILVTQYGNSQDELNRELFKLFDPKGDLKETKANFEAIFESIKEMNKNNPDKLKHYFSTLVQYINYIEETNVGLNNIKNHFYVIIANDAKLDNQDLISSMRKNYLLAKSHKERINSILGQLGDISEDNVFKQMLRKSTSYVDEIENLYFDKSLPLIATVLNSYFGEEFRNKLTKEITDKLAKNKYDLTIAKSDNAKKRINNEIIKLEEQLKLIPNPNLIRDVIKGKYGDSDWFYSSLMANINNPDYVISGTELFMTDIMRDLSELATIKQNEFGRQFSKREDILGINRDQVKEMNKDLVYAANHLVKNADGTTETAKVMTLLTEVNENVYFDYEVLQNELLETEPNTSERKIVADKIKQFENEHFENQFNPKYLKALSAIDVIVSDGRNIKQVRQKILDDIKAIKVKNYKADYLQGEFQNEEDLVTLRELWREFMNLSSFVDRNGNKKTGADLEIAEILQSRKAELEEFREKKVDEDLWKKLKAKKIQSLLEKYNTEQEVLQSEEYKKWQSFNSVISPTEKFYNERQSKLEKINDILGKKEYKDISLVGQLKDNLNQSWEKLLSISREYRDFEREVISGDIPEGTKIAMKTLEENIDKTKDQIKVLEKSLSKQDKKDLNILWEEYNSMIEYKTSKYYEEDLENALNQYALENGLEVNELRNDKGLMTQFKLNNEWYINSHITKERYDKITEQIVKYTEPVYYYKVIVPTNSDYIRENPASQYASFELKSEAYNLDEKGNPNYLDFFGRKKVKKTSKYITENIPYLKIKNDLSPKGKINLENLQFLKSEMENAQKGLNKQNYLYYQIPAERKSTFERVSEGDIKGIKENIKDKFILNAQDEIEVGTRGVLANLSGEEAKFIPVLGKSKIDFKDQSYNIWKSILDYTLSAEKAKMFEEKLPILDALVDQLEKNLPAIEGNKFEAIGESMNKKFGLENVKETIKGRGDKRVQSIKDTVSRYVFEEFTKELANIGGISDIKLTNTLLGYSGATMMFGNIPNWIVNAMSGNIQLMIEASGKRYFTTKDIKNAKVELASRHKDAISDINKTHDKSLFGQMIDYFDPVKGEFIDSLGNKFDWSKRTNLNKIFFSGKIYGEWEMQMTTFIAMLKAKKVEQILPNSTKKMIDLYDAFERGENGIPKLKEGVQITEKELREYMTKIQGINKLLNGSYAKLDQTKIEKYSLGRMAIFMKKFFIPLFVNRFGKFREDAELQDIREGHYISFYNAVVKDMFNIPIGEIYAKMKKSPEDGGYTDLQKTAITKTLVELAFITALTISLVLLGYDDDEDDSDTKKFVQYLALKLRREVATFTPIAAPQEFASFFSRPFAAMSSVGNLINLGGMVLKTPIYFTTGAFEDDLYYQKKTSMWDTGDSKFLALLYKSMGLKLNITHPDQLLQGYNYSIRL